MTSKSRIFPCRRLSQDGCRQDASSSMFDKADHLHSHLYKPSHSLICILKYILSPNRKMSKVEIIDELCEEIPFYKHYKKKDASRVNKLIGKNLSRNKSIFQCKNARIWSLKNPTNCNEQHRSQKEISNVIDPSTKPKENQDPNNGKDNNESTVITQRRQNSRTRKNQNASTPNEQEFVINNVRTIDSLNNSGYVEIGEVVQDTIEISSDEENNDSIEAHMSAKFNPVITNCLNSFLVKAGSVNDIFELFSKDETTKYVSIEILKKYLSAYGKKYFSHFKVSNDFTLWTPFEEDLKLKTILLKFMGIFETTLCEMKFGSSTEIVNFLKDHNNHISSETITKILELYGHEYLQFKTFENEDIFFASSSSAE